MYQKILVPLDGSEFAEAVFPYAKELAARLELEVILLHIVRPEERNFFAPIHRAYVQETVATIRRQAQEVQTNIGPKPGSQSPQVQGETVVGYPSEEILRYAEMKGIDLILMATHGRAGARHWTLGHVAEKILRQSKVPVWLVRAEIPDATPYDKWPKKTLLVPLDGSELAETVLPHVESLAQQRGEVVDVTLLRVCEPPIIPSYETPELSGAALNWGQYIQQEIARCKQTAEEYLAKIEKRFKDKKISVHSETLTGKAAEEITNYATKNPHSLIIMTTHGRTGLRRLVYGSVAESVLLGVSNPIFLVRVH